MRPSGYRPARVLVVSIVVALAALLSLGEVVLAHGGGGSGGPTYLANVSPTTIAAGTASTSTIALTQLVEEYHDDDRELGSVRITVPAGLTISGASAAKGSTPLAVVIGSGTVSVDRVDLDHAGQTASVTIQTTVACGIAGPLTWGVEAHQTYSFGSSHAKVLLKDPTSQLGSQVLACSLAFASQPAGAGVGDVISTVAGDPSAAPVVVQLRDGNGAPAAQAGITVSLAIASGTGTSGASLGGASSGPSGPTGQVSFAPTIDRSGRGYALDASAGAGIDPATSGAFDIDDVAMVCSGACSGSSQTGDTTATVSATTNGGLLTMSLGLDSIDCNNAVNHYYLSTSEVLSFGVTPSAGRKTVIIELAAASVTKPFFKYEVCFSSPNTSFVNKYGATIAAGDPGILPSCKNCGKPSGGPCVVARWKDSSGNVFVKFSVPMADPKGRI